MSQKSIHQSLDEKLSTLAGGYNIAWPNAGYAPTPSVVYLRPSFLPSSTDVQEIGKGGMSRIVGLYQVDVFAPIGEGKAQAESVVESVKALFPRGLSLTKSGVTTIIGSAQVEPGTTNNGSYQISVSFEWRADVAE